jgi:hypothetical protein
MVPPAFRKRMGPRGGMVDTGDLKSFCIPRVEGFVYVIVSFVEMEGIL